MFIKAVLFYNLAKPKTKAVLPKVLEKLDEFGIDIIGENEIAQSTDVIITVGGDGTILSKSVLAAAEKLPLLGINTGRLGFMATLECDELNKLAKLKSGDYNISKRMMLDIRVKGKIVTALNDVVFTKTLYSKLPEFKVSSKGTVISKIRADGIIISTPTGSTAYALSAGGPIIEPEIECIEVTPLCAHTLFGRPMILSADEPLTVSYDKYEGEHVLLSADGRQGIEIHEDEEIVISKSKMYLNLVDIDGNSFYNAVHNKLMRPLK